MTSDAWQNVLITLGAPIIAFLLARVTLLQAETLRATKDTHRVVNSQQTELKDQIKTLQETVLMLSTERAALLEAARAVAAGTVSDMRSAASRAEGVVAGQVAASHTGPTPVEIVSAVAPVPVTVVLPPDTPTP